MADEAEAPAEKKGGNGMMIVLIALIVILLAAVGGIGYFLYSKGMFDPEAPAGATGAKTEQVQEIEKEDIGETFQTKIDALVLNVTNAKGREKLMKLSFSIKSTEPTIAAIVEINKAQIVDSVIAQVSARSSEELLTVGGKAMLKEEMLESINQILNDEIKEDEEVKKDSVKDIFFTAFVIK